MSAFSFSTDPSHQEVTSDRSRYEDNAITLFQHYHNALCQSLHDPISVARMLHGEKILSEATLTIVESTRQTLSQRRTTLLDAALDAIRNSYHNLEVFASVLLKFTDNVPLANAILSDFSEFIYIYIYIYMFIYITLFVPHN